MAEGAAPEQEKEYENKKQKLIKLDREAWANKVWVDANDGVAYLWQCVDETNAVGSGTVEVIDLFRCSVTEGVKIPLLKPHGSVETQEIENRPDSIVGDDPIGGLSRPGTVDTARPRSQERRTKSPKRKKTLADLQAAAKAVKAAMKIRQKAQAARPKQPVRPRETSAGHGEVATSPPEGKRGCSYCYGFSKSKN